MNGLSGILLHIYKTIIHSLEWNYYFSGRQVDAMFLFIRVSEDRATIYQSSLNPTRALLNGSFVWRWSEIVSVCVCVYC